MLSLRSIIVTRIQSKYFLRHWWNIILNPYLPLWWLTYARFLILVIVSDVLLYHNCAISYSHDILLRIHLCIVPRKYICNHHRHYHHVKDVYSFHCFPSLISLLSYSPTLLHPVLLSPSSLHDLRGISLFLFPKRLHYLTFLIYHFRTCVFLHI